MNFENVIENDELAIFGVFGRIYLIFDSMKVTKDGTAIIPVNLVKIKEQRGDKSNFFDAVDDCYIEYDFLNSLCYLVVESMAVMAKYDLFIITTTLEMMKHPNYEDYKALYIDMVGAINEEIKKYIRNNLSINNGKFLNDRIEDNVYTQIRLIDSKSIFYIVNNWWLKDLSEIEFLDIGQKGIIHIAK